MGTELDILVAEVFSTAAFIFVLQSSLRVGLPDIYIYIYIYLVRVVDTMTASLPTEVFPRIAAYSSLAVQARILITRRQPEVTFAQLRQKLVEIEIEHDRQNFITDYEAEEERQEREYDQWLEEAQQRQREEEQRRQATESQARKRKITFVPSTDSMAKSTDMRSNLHK